MMSIIHQDQSKNYITFENTLTNQSSLVGIGPSGPRRISTQRTERSRNAQTLTGTNAKCQLSPFVAVGISVALSGNLCPISRCGSPGAGPGRVNSSNINPGAFTMTITAYELRPSP